LAICIHFKKLKSTPYSLQSESLSRYQQTTNVDILITGNTHELAVFEKNGKLFINPGSASGAFSTIKPYAFFLRNEIVCFDFSLHLLFYELFFFLTQCFNAFFCFAANRK
jgi:predicted phosphodiesterase